jgi:hypothetical protein
MGLGSATGAKMDVYPFSAAIAPVLIDRRITAPQGELVLVERGFDKIGAARRSLAEFAMAVDDIARRPLDRVFDLITKATSQVHWPVLSRFRHPIAFRIYNESEFELIPFKF